MEYKGYTARAVFDEEAGVLFGEVEGVRDVVTFEATSARDVDTAFRESVDDYLEMCAERGEDPEKPYSGRFLVRVEPRLHREISFAAAQAGKSLNAFTSEVLKSWLEKARDLAAPKPTSIRSRPAAPKVHNASGAKEHSLDFFNKAGPRFYEQEPFGVQVGSPEQFPPVIEAGTEIRHTPGSITPRQTRTPEGSRTPRRQSVDREAA